MERKNYLQEQLSKEEKLYLKKMLLNVRRKYIKSSYIYLNNRENDWDSYVDMESESLFETALNNCMNELKSAIEFEKLFSNEKLYNITKALYLKEKMVLFSLYKENKSVNQIATEMNIDRTSVWRIKNKAHEKIVKRLMGGMQDV